ncbi:MULTISPECIES: ATP-binding protein [unclassified Nocardioides]|uniref:sensor histidine kinase n=1 Tax=unclassified Nocardioides TaxID=2615069 RepID=UPI00360675DC
MTPLLHPMQGWHRPRRELLATGLVWAGLTAFVVLVYVVVVLGGGALLGRTSSPSLVLSVLATAVVAVAFDPVQTRLERWVGRVVLGGRASPYDVVRRFTTTLAGQYPDRELPERMARVLADGTGAESAQVWVDMVDRGVLAATWPPGHVPGTGTVARRMPVLHGGENLGALVVFEHPGVPLTPVEERLFAGLADQAALVLRGARLRAELEQRLATLSTRAEELRVSRERLVDAHDAERRRLERDIHDGAQQHLVALAVNLRLAGTLAARSPERADELLADQERAAEDAIATLVRLARGIFPPRLESAGIAEALRAVIAAADVSVELHATGVGRYPPSIEATAYFCCLEALQNAAKHAHATTTRVELVGTPDTLELAIVDDGRGFDPRVGATGAGLTNLRERVESVGGELTVTSTPGQGTRIQAVLPAAVPAGSVA